MKKLINDPHAVVDQMLDGLVKSSPTLQRLSGGYDVIVRADIEAFKQNRVTIISGGGSGHEPAQAGFVGKGLLSAAVCGHVFTSPDVDSVLAAIRAVNGPKGTLIIVMNYTGDKINFGLAAEVARTEGRKVELVVVADDCALEESAVGQRGIAGTVFVHKLAGAAAEAGASLEEVAGVARNAAEAVGTMGVGLSSCIIPVVGKPNFDLGPDEIEFGLGIHGEPGRERKRIGDLGHDLASTVVDQLLSRILTLRPGRGKAVALMVNNLGGTSQMELFVVANSALKYLAAHGFKVDRVFVGMFMTSIEMAGISLTLLWTDSDTLLRLDADTDAPAWPRVPAVDAEAAKPAVAAVAGPADAAAVLPPSQVPSASGRVVKEVISAVCNAIIAEASALGQLDSVVGDGDMGMNLEGGAKSLLAALPTEAGTPASSSAGGVLPVNDLPACLSAVAQKLRRDVGGTSGPIYAVFFVRLAAVLKAAGDITPAAWADALKAGAEAISKLGGASKGDRTLLDALIPAANAYAASVANSATVAQALEAATTAARAGVKATCEMVPRRGRSSYLGQRAVGHPDPGASAVALIVYTVHKALA